MQLSKLNEILNSLIIIIFKSQILFGQFEYYESEANKQSIFVEILGNSRSIISINYERFWGDQEVNKIIFSTRIGVGYTPGNKVKNLKGFTSIPLSVSALYGTGKNHIVFGLHYTGTFGQNFIDSSYAPPKYFLNYESAFILSLGYRFMKYKGVMLELCPVSLVWTNNPTSRFMMGFGFSIGHAF